MEINKFVLIAAIAAAAVVIPAREDTPQARISLAALQAQIDALETTVAALQTRLACVDAASDADDFVFTGCNVHVRNGDGATDTVNGFGNLIVGYDEASGSSPAICSDGTYDNQTDCEDNGATWSHSQKTGSHNLVVGVGHSYTQYGGFIAGRDNTVNRLYATVTGGSGNIASGWYSSVSGGNDNVASGNWGSVSGGGDNTASGSGSSVSGGSDNTASGNSSSVSGGNNNTAGEVWSSVSGGASNTANGRYSNVSGGASRSVTGTSDWRAGLLFQDF